MEKDTNRPYQIERDKYTDLLAEPVMQLIRLHDQDSETADTKFRQFHQDGTGADELNRGFQEWLAGL